MINLSSSQIICNILSLFLLRINNNWQTNTYIIHALSKMDYDHYFTENC